METCPYTKAILCMIDSSQPTISPLRQFKDCDLAKDEKKEQLMAHF